MTAGMAEIIAAHKEIENLDGYTWGCQCGWEAQPVDEHPAHLAEELTKAGYGNVQEAKAEALTDAADWLLNGEAVGIIAYDGPSNRGEVMAAYDAALEDPESWLRERAEAARAVDPVDLYCEARDGMAEAWDEGFREGERQGAEGDDGPKFMNPYMEPQHG